MSIADNIITVREQIARACRKAGRRPQEVLLVAAAKQNGATAVREAIKAGVDAVGENRVNELLEKDGAGAYTGAPLHFIGHLQRNKAKQVVGRAALIHSADSFELVSLINALAAQQSIVQELLCEINIAREPSKSGIAPGEADAFLHRCAAFSSVRFVGLMAIPPAEASESELRRFFSRMNKLFVDIGTKKYDNNNMQYLSMGMSGDFGVAIEEGSNMVRVGSAIFGSRSYE